MIKLTSGALVLTCAAVFCLLMSLTGLLLDCRLVTMTCKEAEDNGLGYATHIQLTDCRIGAEVIVLAGESPRSRTVYLLPIHSSEDVKPRFFVYSERPAQHSPASRYSLELYDPFLFSESSSERRLNQRPGYDQATLLEPRSRFFGVFLASLLMTGGGLLLVYKSPARTSMLGF